MNGRQLRFFGASCVALIGLLLPTAQADIEFVGILATPHLVRFALTDTSDGHSAWVERGAQFGGYTIAAYEAKGDLLTLQKAGQELRLRLKDDAKIKSAPLELTGEITFGSGEKLDVSRATLRFDQENVFPLRDGITFRITPTRREDGTLRYAIVIESRQSDNKVDRISAPSVIVAPGNKFSLRVGDLAFSFTPIAP